MHKDQTRVQDTVLPTIAARIHDPSPEAERDCTILVRLLVQGPDPLYLMETYPRSFSNLCVLLALSEDLGRKAIEAAHWQGPATLFEEGTLGMPLDRDAVLLKVREMESLAVLPLGWRQEILWLLMAQCSDCTEEGYKEKTTLLERIQRATTAGGRLQDLTKLGMEEVCIQAFRTLGDFIDKTPVETDDAGHPHTNVDHGFYVLYKRGHECVAVHTEKDIFWGTIPSTSLEEQGVQVDKLVSPQFGISFG